MMRGGLVPAALMLALLCGGARAERIVLAPSGLIVPPNSLSVQYASQFTNDGSHFGWATVGLPGQDLGVEVEASQGKFSLPTRDTFGLQYSITGNLFTDLAPAVSVGLRDALNSGWEGRALYLAMTKSFGLSAAQKRLLTNLRVTAGYGTGRMGGLFVGAETRVQPGVLVNAEVLARRLNVSAGLPLARYVQARAYDLNGSMFYGLSVSVQR